MSTAKTPRLVGVIHLPPLPGAPGFPRGAVEPQLADVAARVRADAATLARAGFDAVVLENFGDAPFVPDRVEPITIAAMTRCALAAREVSSLPLVVNVLRNDALAALAIAIATGARWIRVNVHVGAAVTDQGLIQGRAHETLRARRAWGGDEPGAPSIGVWADVDVKHAAQLAPRPVADVAHDAATRGHVEALIVTGAATGAAADPRKVEEVARAVEHDGVPILIGSGAAPDRLVALRDAGAHGVIVGSWLRADGRAGGPIDFDRSAAFAAAFRRVFD
jgi:membrane complex biogenesis BtpA family protein